MLLKKFFFKPNLIAFYKEEDIFKVLNEQYNNEKVIFSETKEFKTLNELQMYIKSVMEDNPQTYVSTIIHTQNQGVVPSCEKKVFKNIGIELDNVKYICIKNQYSFYITLYELIEAKKEYKNIDFLYSPFALIDYKTSLRKNALYILSTKEYAYILVYRDSLPVFSDIFDMIDTTEDNIENEEIEDISAVDIIEDFDETLDEDIENIDEDEIEDEEKSIKNLNLEYKISEQVKSALREYYESGGDFIEKIFIFDTIGIDKNITNIIKDELFIEVSLEKLKILKTINEISRENV